VRGAFHAISRLPEDVRKKGIVTHSSGESESFRISLS
jgi:threonine dehydratase